jgi:hypothetical protein
VLQPKYDGSYTTARTDDQGRLTHLVLRNGGELGPDMMAEFAGVRWAPSSILIAEAEVWTEASARVAARRGYRMLHVFDALRIEGRDVSQLPYQGRRDELLRAQTALAEADPDQPWLASTGWRAHDPATGQFVRPVPLSWRRMPVVEQLPADRADNAWADWVEPGAEAIEGLVAVALGGKLAGRAAKRKVKRTDHLDATVVEAGQRTARLRWAGGSFLQVYYKAAELRPGMVVEVKCDGYYESSGEPKFSRIVRVRPDLSPRSARP